MTFPSLDRHIVRSLAAVLAATTIILLGGLAQPAAAARANPFDAAEAKVEALATAGKLDAAIAASRRLVAAARRDLKKDPKLALFLTELSLLEAQRGHLVEAEAAAREALAINSAVAEPDSPLVQRSLAALAEVLAKGAPNKLLEAEALLARAIISAEDATGPGSPEVVGLQQKLADVLDRQGRKAEADQLRAQIELALAAAKPKDLSASAEFKPRASASEGGKSTGNTAGEEQTSPAPAPFPSSGAKKEFHHKSTKPSAPSPDTEVTKAPPPSPSPGPAGASQAEEAQPPLPPPPAPTESPTTAAPGAPEFHVVDVFFGTNRQPTDGTQRVSFNAAEGSGLTLGEAHVTVPATHRVPEVERPWSIRVPFTQIELSVGSDDPTRYFTIQSITTLPEDAFVAHAKAQLAQSQAYKGQALVFVHGFYNRFDDALYRTAQIAYDMQFDGAAFMFSWPSAGTIDAYIGDRAKAERAGPQLRAFLDLVARRTGANRVTVIAHSMGNLPLMEALDETVPGQVPSPTADIDDVVLAAPDIGRKEFSELASHMKRIRGGLTLYAASNDLALEASRDINGEPRAGDTRPDGPLLLPHLDTIDATGTSFEMFRLNHFYVAESSAVLCDLERLLQTGTHPPDTRTKLLVPIVAGSGTYYSFR